MGTAVDAPWMTAPATRAVIGALAADGAEVRFVGGCVRDALLERESDDIDIGTPDPPERVLALLESAGIETRTLPRGIAHGTVTALAGGMRFEITTLRRDVATDGRHAEVAFTDDWKEDAARRDFTINAMSTAPDGTLHDYFGGQADLAAGRVRFVGDPARRIAEDHLRILRFFRFHAWYGKGEPDAAALAACKDAAHTIPSLSGERVQGEMMKLLAAENPVPALTAMQDAGVLARLLPDTGVLARILPIELGTETLARLVPIEGQVAEPDPIRRLAAMIADASPDFPERPVIDGLITGRLLQTGADVRRIISVVKLATSLSVNLDRRGQRALVYRNGQAHFRDAVLLAWAKHGKNGAIWRVMLKTVAEWVPPEFPLTGADVIERGAPEGPEVGRLLAAIEEWWIKHDFQPDRAAALEKLDALIAESRDR